MKQRSPKSSISRQLIASVLLIMAALVGAVSLLITYLLTHSYDRQIKVEGGRASASIRQSVYWFMDGAYNLTEELAVNPSILTMDPDVQIPILQNSAARNDYLELLYIQKPDGMQIARSDSIAPGSRAGRWWFEKIIVDRQPFVSKSYYSIKTKMPVVSIYIPMYAGDEFIGIFGSDIKLVYIQQLIERVSDKNDGRYSFIIDGDGVVIAHPNSEYLRTLTNFKKLTRRLPQKTPDGKPVLDERGGVVEVETPYSISDKYRVVVDNVMAGQSGTAVIREDGTTYYASYAPIDLPGHSDSWSVITLQDKSAAMSIVSTLLWQIILIALIIASAAVMAFILIVRKKISRPVKTLTDAAERISYGDLDAEVPSLVGDGSDEILVMADALNRMVTRLRLHTVLQLQAQAVTAAKLQFGLFINEAETIRQTFRMTVAVLRYHYETSEFGLRSAGSRTMENFGSSLKITAVYANPDPVYTLIYSKARGGWGEDVTNDNLVDTLISDNEMAEAETYPHHAEIKLSLGKKRSLFLNDAQIKERGMLFADSGTKLAGITTLMSFGKTYGYIIVESDNRQELSVVSDENFLRQAANELSAWIQSRELKNSLSIRG